MLIPKRDNERQIIFTGPMVCQILAGNKTVTRRLNDSWLKAKKGDYLWVRETCQEAYFSTDNASVVTGCARYLADGRLVMGKHLPVSWWYSKPICPSIHMPRRVCRLLLRVTEDVRAEKLGDISRQPSEIKAEGLDVPAACPDAEGGYEAYYYSYEKPFIDLWDSINGKDPDKCYAANPTVYRVPFEIAEVAT